MGGPTAGWGGGFAPFLKSKCFHRHWAPWLHPDSPLVPNRAQNPFGMTSPAPGPREAGRPGMNALACACFRPTLVGGAAAAACEAAEAAEAEEGRWAGRAGVGEGRRICCCCWAVVDGGGIGEGLDRLIMVGWIG